MDIKCNFFLFSSAEKQKQQPAEIRMEASNLQDIVLNDSRDFSHSGDENKGIPLYVIFLQ